MDDKGKEVVGLWEEGDSDAAIFKVTWQDCALNIQPNRNDYIVDRPAGVKRMQTIFDGTPGWCLQQFTAGCHSQITSSTVIWFALRAEDDRVDRLVPVRAWLEAATATMFTTFNSPRYNFPSQSAELYEDEGSIGTGCMAVLEGRGGMPLFSTRHMKECRFFENEEEKVDTLVRRWKWTAKQAKAKWGDKAGADVAKALEQNKPNEPFYFLHAVRPRRDRNPDRIDARNMAFESVYVAEKNATVISESGFQEFPYLTPRYSKASGEKYGRSQTMWALPDIKMLYEAKKLVLKSAQKIIDPPLDVPNDTYLLGIKSLPGSINFRQRNTRPDDRIQPILTQGNIPIGNDLLQSLKADIGRAFFTDILRMPTDPDDPSSEGKGSTATYWAQRREKEFMAMSPFLARVRGELAGPLIDRVFAMLFRRSKALKFGPGSPFPPPPAELSRAALRVEYVSPIELAQRANQNDAVDRLLARQAQLRQIDPKSPIIVDFEAVMRETGKDVNTPIALLKTPEKLQQEAQAAADAEQALQQHMQLANLAGAAKDGSAAIKNISDAQGNDNDAGAQQEAA